jgi:hypothetical protein
LGKASFFERQISANLLDASADQHWLLLERQINADQNETLAHAVRQVMTTDGVQNGSTLKIDFNPGHETLTWHWARICRSSQHLERLDANNVKIF